MRPSCYKPLQRSIDMKQYLWITSYLHLCFILLYFKFTPNETQMQILIYIFFCFRSYFPSYNFLLKLPCLPMPSVELWLKASSTKTVFSSVSWTMQRNASRICCYASIPTSPKEKLKICAMPGTASLIRNSLWLW